MSIDLKSIRWLGATLDEIHKQRPAIRYEFGQQLFRVQIGLMPNNYKPMSTVGPGAYEIRVKDADGIARLCMSRSSTT
jgi:phage-related protein